jgi:septation ring formation regulator EzrA
MDKPVMGDKTLKMKLAEKETLTEELKYFLFKEQALTKDYAMHEHKGKQIVDKIDTELVVLRHMRDQIQALMDDVFGMHSSLSRPLKDVSEKLAEIKYTIDRLKVIYG